MTDHEIILNFPNHPEPPKLSLKDQALIMLGELIILGLAGYKLYKICNFISPKKKSKKRSKNNVRK